MAKNTASAAKQDDTSAPASESPEDWVANNNQLIGPDGFRYRAGILVEGFDSWPDLARERLIGMGWVKRRREFKGVRITSRHVIPKPHALAVAPGHALSEGERPKHLPPEPVFPHNMDLGDGVKVEEPMDRMSLPVILRPGEEVNLSDGSTYKVPLRPAAPELESKDPGVREHAQVKAVDMQENQVAICNDCGKEFAGLSSLKLHETRAHRAKE